MESLRRGEGDLCLRQERFQGECLLPIHTVLVTIRHVNHGVGPVACPFRRVKVGTYDLLYGYVRACGFTVLRINLQSGHELPLLPVGEAHPPWR